MKRVWWLCVAVLVSGCETRVPAENAFDPNTSTQGQATATLSGTVWAADDSDQTPLAGVEAALLDADGVPVQTVTTEADGTFVFPERTPGIYTLEVTHVQYLRRVQTVELGPGDTLHLAIALDPRGESAGDTTHLFGVAHKAAQLARPTSEQDHSGILVEVLGVGVRTVTNQSGDFDVFLATGTYDLSFSAADHNPVRRDGVVGAMGDVEIPDSPVVLPVNPARILGVVHLEGVTGTTGHAGASVALEGGVAVTTADDGAFTLADVPAGVHTLVISLSGYQTLRVPGLSLVGGAERDLGTLDLALARGSVEGTVLLAGETEHGGTLVALDGTAFAAQTTPDGRFALAGVPEGTYGLTARRPGYLSGTAAGVAVVGETTTPVAPITLAPFVVSIELAGGAGAVMDPAVAVALDAPLAAQVRLGETPDLSGASWVAMAASTNLTLSGGDGLHTVYAEFQAADGTVSELVSDAVRLDTTSPTVGAIVLGDGSGYVTVPGATPVNATCGDGGEPTTLSITEATAGVLFTGETAPPTLDLGAGDGDRSLTFTCTDAAGNSTTVGPVVVTVDTTAPTIDTFTLVRTAPSIGPTNKTNVLLVDVVLATSDAGAGSPRVALAETSLDCVNAVYDHPGTGSVAFTLLPEEGTHQLLACAKDAAGNTTATPVNSQNTLTLDTVGPATPALIRTGLTNTSVDLAWTTPADPDLASFVLERAVEGEGLFSSLANPGAADTSYSDTVDPANLGLLHTYRVAAIDDLGNPGGWSIELDAGVPFDPPRAFYGNAPQYRERVVAWTRPQGSNLTLATYAYEAAGQLYEEAIAPNASQHLVGDRLKAGSPKENERIVVRSQNRDGSLTWTSTFPFGVQTQLVTRELSTHFEVGVLPDGRWVLVWGSNANNDVRMLRKGDTTPTVLDANSGKVTDLDLAVEDDGTLHVVYPCSWNMPRYTRVDPDGTLTIVDLDDNNRFKKPTAMCMDIDSTGTPHLGFDDNFAGEFLYVAIDDACVTGGYASCTFTTIDTGFQSGDMCDLAVDGNDDVHVIHAMPIVNELRYQKVGGPWVVLESGTQNAYPSVAVDTQGRPHFVYDVNTGTQHERRYVEGSPRCLTSPASGCIRVVLDTDGAAPAGHLDLELDPAIGVLSAWTSRGLAQVEPSCARAGGCAFDAMAPVVGSTALDDAGVVYLARQTTEGITLTILDGAPDETPITTARDYLLGGLTRGPYKYSSPDGTVWLTYVADDGLGVRTLFFGPASEWGGRAIQSPVNSVTPEPVFDVAGVPYGTWRDTNPTDRFGRLDQTVTGSVLVNPINTARFVGFIGGDVQAVYDDGGATYLSLDATCLADTSTGCSPMALNPSGLAIFYSRLGADGSLHSAWRVSDGGQLAHYDAVSLTPDCVAGTASCPTFRIDSPTGTVSTDFALAVPADATAPPVLVYGGGAGDPVRMHLFDTAGTDVPLSELPAGGRPQSAAIDGAGFTHLFVKGPFATPWQGYYYMIGSPLPPMAVSLDQNCDIAARDDGLSTLTCKSQSGNTGHLIRRGRFGRELTNGVHVSE